MNKKRFYIISSTLLLIGLFSGVVQYIGVIDTIYAAINNPGHSWSQMECSTALCIDTANDRVGVGTTSPQASLDVAGSIKLGNQTTCDASSAGSIRSSGVELSMCNGEAWYPFSSHEPCGTSFTDPRDGTSYSVKLFGNQCWMTQNLKYFPSAPLSTVNPSNCYYTQSSPQYHTMGCDYSSVATIKACSYYITYGILYNNASAQISCPSGWHLPSPAEYNTLIATTGGTYSSMINGGTSGFNAIPQGYIVVDDYNRSIGFGGYLSHPYVATGVFRTSDPGVSYTIGTTGSWNSHDDWISSTYSQMGGGYFGAFVRCVRND